MEVIFIQQDCANILKCEMNMLMFMSRKKKTYMTNRSRNTIICILVIRH